MSSYYRCGVSLASVPAHWKVCRLSSDSDDMDLAEPWRSTEPDEAIVLERELAIEIGPGHPLAGIPARALGRRDDRDDVLFELGPGGWAIVHLTFRQSQEQDVRWPRSERFGSLEDLLTRIRQDVLDRAT